jgi:hypothetical protein
MTVEATTARRPAAKVSVGPPPPVVKRAGILASLSGADSGGDEGDVGVSATSGFAGAHPYGSSERGDSEASGGGLSSRSLLSSLPALTIDVSTTEKKFILFDRDLIVWHIIS